MTHHEGFMHAIIERPDDETPRLVYADWLDENGQPERAEFIRIQCELAKMMPDDRLYTGLQLRQRKLFAEHSPYWLGKLRGPFGLKDFQRGFLARVRLHAQSFVAHANTLFRLGPIRDVSLTGVGMHVILIASSPYLQRLERLDLKGGKTGLRDWGVGCLCRSANLARLSHLDLGNNGIGDEGASLIAGSSALGGLTQLRLSGNHIGDEGLSSLAGSEYLHALTMIDLSGNEIDRRRRGARALLGRFGDRVRL